MQKANDGEREGAGKRGDIRRENARHKEEKMARSPNGSESSGKIRGKKGDYYYTGNERVPGKRGRKGGGLLGKMDGNG